MTESFDKDFSFHQLTLLVQGLNALEAAINAIGQKIPAELVELKKTINIDIESGVILQKKTLTTDQAATILRCSGKRVHQLAAAGKIKIAQTGKKGRSFSTQFFSDSIKEYAIKKSKNIHI